MPTLETHALSKSEGITFDEMIRLCRSEAFRIEINQHELVADGTRTRADPGQMRNKLIFEKIVDLVELIRGDKVIIDRLKQKTAKATNRGSEVSHRVAGDDG